MTTKTAAMLIALEIESICTAERIADFAADDSGNEALVRGRLGRDYVAAAWDDAMDLLRERHA